MAADESYPSGPTFDNGDLMMYDDFSTDFDTLISNDSYMSSDGMPDDIVWCFDLTLYYMNQTMAENVSYAQTHSYRLMNLYGRFSFVVNGLATLMFAVFGGVGNMLLFCQIRRSHYFSRRLAAHLAMLCLWDTLLLFSGMFSYGVLSLYYGMYPFHGVAAYLLYIFQPIGSLSVTGTLWQVSAITIERFLAVSRPLEQRTRKAKFSVKWICVAIAALAVLLNLPTIPLERNLELCYILTEDSIEASVMNMPTPIGNNPIFALLVHLIPDLIFRCPFPIVLVAVLTIRTMQLCRKRTVGTNMIQMRHRRNVPFMLTLLNVKFVLCNTLYMFNTIVMEIMGYGYSSKNTEMSSDLFQQFVITLYLTDLANMLLAAHSATNWLLFYHWPRVGRVKRNFTRASTLTSSLGKRDLLEVHQAKLLLEHTSLNMIDAEIATALSNDDQQLFHQLFPADYCPELNTDMNAQQHCLRVCYFILAIIKRFADKHATLTDIREECRRVGRQHQRYGVHLTAKEWKRTRDALTQLITQTFFQRIDDKSVINSHRPSIIKVVNFVLSEMKSGAFCEAVASSTRPRLQTYSVADNDSSPLLTQEQQRRRSTATVKRACRSLNTTPILSTRTDDTQV